MLGHPLCILQRLYVVGRDESKVRWRILKIDRSEPSDLVLTEDPVCYDKRSCHKLIRELAEGNKGSGGLHLLAKAHGIVGESPLPHALAHAKFLPSELARRQSVL